MIEYKLFSSLPTGMLWDSEKDLFSSAVERSYYNLACILAAKCSPFLFVKESVSSARLNKFLAVTITMCILTYTKNFVKRQR